MSKKRTLKYFTGQSYERTILKTEKFISKDRRWGYYALTSLQYWRRYFTSLMAKGRNLKQFVWKQGLFGAVLSTGSKAI